MAARRTRQQRAPAEQALVASLRPVDVAVDGPYRSGETRARIDRLDRRRQRDAVDAHSTQHVVHGARVAAA